jgi:hypothetical protein
VLGLTYAICGQLACEVGWCAARGHPTKKLPSSWAREYRWVDVVEDYVRFSRPTAKNLIFYIGVPIMYAAVAAPFREECEVHAKPSGGCSCNVRSSRCSHVVKVSAVQFVVGSCRLMAHRLSGIFPAENLVRAAFKYLSNSAMLGWAESGNSHRSFRSVEVPR